MAGSSRARPLAATVPMKLRVRPLMPAASSTASSALPCSVAADHRAGDQAARDRRSRRAILRKVVEVLRHLDRAPWHCPPARKERWHSGRQRLVVAVVDTIEQPLPARGAGRQVVESPSLFQENASGPTPEKRALLPCALSTAQGCQSPVLPRLFSAVGAVTARHMKNRDRRRSAGALKPGSPIRSSQACSRGCTAISRRGLEQEPPAVPAAQQGQRRRSRDRAR